jgi:uncharacterized membrane protein (UPF0127 family)
MMGNQKTTLIVMFIALMVFLFVKVAPKFKSNVPTHTSGKVKKKVELHKKPSFHKDGNGWFISDKGDTLVHVNIEIANTDFKITKGLMDRPHMREDNGMLFTFIDEDKRSFWMKNTIIPLDIIYITEKGNIDSFYKSTVPFSVKPLPSTGAVKYVLEVNGGFLDIHEITSNTHFVYNHN